LRLAVSVSIGVAIFLPVPATVEAMRRAADQQMYRVKQQRKNNLACHLWERCRLIPGSNEKTS
jgi:GGDEF domain-containing protein